MILVDNYIGAILCCVYCCLCWGSWANTQKMVTSKSWSFELFYWDLTFGLFIRRPMEYNQKVKELINFLEILHLLAYRIAIQKIIC